MEMKQANELLSPAEMAKIIFEAVGDVSVALSNQLVLLATARK